MREFSLAPLKKANRTLYHAFFFFFGHSLQHVGSSPTRDQTHALALEVWSLNH